MAPVRSEGPRVALPPLRDDEETPRKKPGSDDRPGARAQDPGSPAGEARARARERRQALKRASFLGLTFLALALTARAVVGERGLLDARRSLRELDRVQGEVEKWRQRNLFLERRIKALREDPTTIESIARERLDWVRPGEITFLFPHDPATLEPGDPGPAAPGEFSPAHADELDPQSGDAAGTAKR